MSTSREYVVGLPVIITVHDDGRVEFEIDKGEASSAIFEHASDLDEDTMLADSLRIERAVFEEGFRWMVRQFGGGFHPDTPPHDYVSLPEGITAPYVEHMLTQASNLGLDVYRITLDVLHEERS